VIEAYYDAFNRKDWSGMLALLDDDVVHDANQGPREVGKPAFSAFLDLMHRHYDEQLEGVVVMTETTGRRAAAELTCNGTYHTTATGLPPARGQRYSLPVGAFFELTPAGKIGRVTNYYNLTAWIAQVR
jgi:steroid delta-isomerase-like uncharacterized protein